MSLRWGMGVIGTICVGMLPVLAATSGWEVAQQTAWVGLLFRTGVLLLATALAWPQLQTLGRRWNGPAGWAAAALAAVLIIRPKLVPVALLVATLAWLANYALRFAAGSKPRR